ncbi:MAG: hypothetical protein HC945_01140 [Nitrosarchaeum sp.]|nr:hypothetical protein [Nitrosarchaeum sp.]
MKTQVLSGNLDSGSGVDADILASDAEEACSVSIDQIVQDFEYRLREDTRALLDRAQVYRLAQPSPGSGCSRRIVLGGLAAVVASVSAGVLGLKGYASLARSQVQQEGVESRAEQTMLAGTTEEGKGSQLDFGADDVVAPRLKDRLLVGAAVPILMYHEIGGEASRYSRSPRQLLVEDLLALHDQGFRAMTLNEFRRGDYSSLQSGQLPIVLTFDDATPAIFLGTLRGAFGSFAGLRYGHS